MKIARYGSTANHGTSTIDLKKIRVAWDEEKKSVVIRSNSVRDFNTDSNHNYRIEIPLDELASIISLLGSEGVNSCPDTIEHEFEKHIKSLNRIIYAASGILTKSSDDVV
jgi:archaellin